MHQHHHRTPPSRRRVVQHTARHFLISLGLLLISLLMGMTGYSHYEHLPWRDAFLNSAMLLSGMGPVDQELTNGGKVFAGLYALYSGLLVIAVTGLLLAPSVHHLMKRVHWEDHDDTE